MGRDERMNPQAAKFIGPNDTLDARGRVLREGDEILFVGKGPLYFRVAGTNPVLDPAAPPGLIHVHIGCMATFVAKRGGINPEFVRVRTAEEAGPSEFKLLDATEPPKGQTS